MQEIYIYGCGGVGNEIAECLMNSAEYRLAGFIDDNPEIRECMGYPSRTLTETLAEKNPEEIRVIISVGEPAVREKISGNLRARGITEETVRINTHLNEAFSRVGEGTLLHDSSYISVNASVGRCCMINKGVLVGHDCTVGDYCVLSPRVTLGGNVSVGEGTFIGTGALLRNGISVGKNAIIGMGSVVVKDVEDDAVVVGNPAKFVRKNETGRVFRHN